MATSQAEQLRKYDREQYQKDDTEFCNVHEAKRGMKDSFESVARRLECDKDRGGFESALGTIARAKAAPNKGKQKPK